MIGYIGNGAYCYANSAAMLLRSAGEDVAPSRIEVLTGVGLGASLEGELLFFNLPAAALDTGLSRAFRILGWDVKEKFCPEDGEPPLDELREELQTGPAVLGPLDMGELAYIPHHRNLAGADHYVLALSLEKDHLHLHDPAGYPSVFLSLDRLAVAWRADRIPYRRGAFRRWIRPIRVAEPSEEEVQEAAFCYFRNLYRESRELAARTGKPVGAEAIRSAADQVEAVGMTERQKGHFVYFALPLGAKRSLDFTDFFNAVNPELTRLKREQARLFGSPTPRR